MKDSLRLTLMITIALAAVTSVTTRAEAQVAPLVRFIGGIGVNPVSNITGSGATTAAVANVVRGVPPGGLIWVIRSLDAKIDASGHIFVFGSGLLLAGGDVIGTTGGQSVFATVFCGPAGSATASSSSATGVALDPEGDFLIEDVLTPVPANPCVNPVLLIRSATVASNPWFAAGIPQ